MSKEFKTLTIRDLDDPKNKEVVKIMNDFASRYGIKTGQDIFLKMVKDYDWQKRQNSDQNMKFNKTLNEKDKEIEELQNELADYKMFFESFSKTQRMFIDLQTNNDSKNKKLKKSLSSLDSFFDSKN